MSSNSTYNSLIERVRVVLESESTDWISSEYGYKNDASNVTSVTSIKSSSSTMMSSTEKVHSLDPTKGEKIGDIRKYATRTPKYMGQT
jgi:hypothetical protein